jgi:hypothetical protein
MNDPHDALNHRDAAAALRARAQRRSDAVVAQYLNELSGRHQRRAAKARRDGRGEHALAPAKA